MEKQLTHICEGTCSYSIDLVLEGDTVKSVEFHGGCDGNTQGVAKLAAGRSVQELIPLLKGIDCDGKGTSCPDQLARALEKALA